MAKIKELAMPVLSPKLASLLADESYNIKDKSVQKIFRQLYIMNLQHHRLFLPNGAMLITSSGKFVLQVQKKTAS